MSACDEVDVMTVDGMEDNVEGSSNPNDVSNVVPKTGVPDYWLPSSYDDKPTLQVTLPTVNGVPPTHFELMTIKINAQNFDTVTVEITDSQNNIVFRVRLRSYMV